METLLELPFYILTDWPIGTVLSLSFFALIGFIGWLVWQIIQEAIDTSFGTQEVGRCLVVNKKVYPAHISMMYVGKVMIPRHIPTTYEITLEKNRKQGSIEVSREYFSHIHKGMEIDAVYTWGKLTGGLYIDKVY